MTGFVVDPSTLPPKRAQFVPSPGQAHFVVSMDGVAQTAGFERFATFAQANAVAQLYNNGLDAIDNRFWGVLPATG